MSVKAAENGLNKAENIIKRDNADAVLKCFSVFLIKRLYAFQRSVFPDTELLDFFIY